MKISNIKIKNFRNLKNINIDLNQHTVLVGANGSGKSNLLLALRLILDQSLSDKKRFLDSDDFWEGLDKPFCGEEIEIHIEIKEFKENVKLLACLHDALIDENTAKLSYVYRPRNKLEKEKAISKGISKVHKFKSHEAEYITQYLQPSKIETATATEVARYLQPYAKGAFNVQRVGTALTGMQFRKKTLHGTSRYYIETKTGELVKDALSENEKKVCLQIR